MIEWTLGSAQRSRPDWRAGCAERRYRWAFTCPCERDSCATAAKGYSFATLQLTTSLAAPHAISPVAVAYRPVANLRRFRTLRPVALQPVTFHQAVKRGAIDSSATRGFGQVAARVRDYSREELTVELRQQLIAGIVIARIWSRELHAEAAIFGECRHTKERQVFRAHLACRLEQHHRVLDHVL